MNKYRIILFAICLHAIGGVCYSQSDEATTRTTEVSIYQIKPEQQVGFEEKLEVFQVQVREMDGYQDYLTLQNIEDSSKFIDILHWDNLNFALAAAKEVETKMKYKPFTTAINESIFYGDLYTFLTYDHKNTVSIEDKTVEVVVYRIKENSVTTYKEIANTTNLFLSKQNGFYNRKILQDHNNPAIFMDIIIWGSLEDAQDALKASQEDATLLPFFEATEKVLTFSHYRFYKKE